MITLKFNWYNIKKPLIAAFLCYTFLIQEKLQEINPPVG